MKYSMGDGAYALGMGLDLRKLCVLKPAISIPVRILRVSMKDTTEVSN